MNRNRSFSHLKPLVLTALALCIAAMTARADDRQVERLPFRATLSVTGLVILPSDAAAYKDHVTQCFGQAPVQVVQGVGEAWYMGLVTDTQSHCLGQPEASGLPFFNGQFTFTNDQGKTLTGRYNALDLGQLPGHLTPTINSRPLGSPQNPTEGNSWVIEGLVCISGGTLFHHIVNDCDAGRFSRALGISLLNNNFTSQSTLYLNLSIGVRD